MKMRITAIAAALTGIMILSLPGTSMAKDKAKSLSELLNFVEQGRVSEGKQNRKREAQFKQAKGKQIEMTNQADAARVQEEQRSTNLEQQFEENDKALAETEKRLRERMGSLTELFGHITTAAGDARSNFDVSLTRVHYPDRDKKLELLVEKTSSGTELPSIEEIEGLWFELQREMTESGRVVTFTETVIKPNGDTSSQSVVRVGTYNLVSEEGQYLTVSKKGLEELPRQPDSSYTSNAARLVASTSGFTAFGADPTGPSGGTYLSALINSPTIVERWHQGKLVGYIISGVGVIAAIIAIWRLIALTLIGTKVNAQLKSDKANANNPLGRVLAVHEANPNMDPETLELKLSEAVLKELPSLESSLNLLKIIAAVAPLLGLLGTVTGMILTFQAITIFGAGDPKAMAGGISSALITTVLGLVVAIPTVLLHTVVSGRSKRIIHILEEQTTGIIAEQSEKTSKLSG